LAIPSIPAVLNAWLQGHDQLQAGWAALTPDASGRRASHSSTATATSCCKEVFSTVAISFKRAAVPRDMENVMVSALSNLPRGLAMKCLMVRFLMADFYPDFPEKNNSRVKACWAAYRIMRRHFRAAEV
jgi:hypothetical protein